MKTWLTPLKLRLLLCSIALFFGVIVLSVSLISTNHSTAYEGLFASDRKLYFDEAILPDHLLYPFIALADRAFLTLAPADDKIEINLSYSQIRMDYAWGLFLKGEEEQALCALTKSQKYLHWAVQASQKRASSDDLVQEIKEALKQNINQVEKMIDQTSHQNRDLASSLNDTSKYYLDQLNSK